MTSRRSYLETINAGRQRRAAPSLDDLNRTLEALESQLERPRPFAGLESETPHRGQAALRNVTRDFERTRREGDGAAAVGQIAAELNALREEMRAQMADALAREFEGLRSEVRRIAHEASENGPGAGLDRDIERLQAAIADLATRSDDRSVSVLRLELEQVKAGLGGLAREDTLRDFDRRMTRFAEEVSSRDTDSDPAIAALTGRLEEIAIAVDALPSSLSITALEERVRTLASALDGLARQQDTQSAQTFDMIGERLDEISRAIAASVGTASAARFDPEPFQRIEARMASLASQIEELVDDRPSREVLGQIAALSTRVDEIAARAVLPEKAVERLGNQLTAIVDRLEKEPSALDANAVFDGLERRFADLAEALDRRQNEANEQGSALLHDLDARLESIVTRLDAQATNSGSELLAVMDERFADLSARLDDRVAFGPEAASIRSLEIRLEDIAARIEASSRQAGNVDSSIIQRLETQVADLTAYLSRPAQSLPALDDLAPRFDQIERSIASQHQSLIDAAREAAVEAVRELSSEDADPQALAALSSELQAFETLTRKSDERNARTFEAIHDTLIKIVDRLGAMEQGEPAPSPAAAPRMPAAAQLETRVPVLDEPKPVLSETPSIAADDAEPLLDEEVATARQELGERSVRSPAEAAAAAAAAAMKNETGLMTPVADKRSMLGGLRGAFRRRKEKAGATEIVETAALEKDEPSLDQPLDPKLANQPLEPGSGAPDLNAIMKRVREERGPLNRKDEIDAAKSDFIAAARRAAQAAAAEAVIKKKSGDDGGSARSRFGALLSARRKTVLMGTVAIAVGLAGVQLSQAFLSDGEQVAATDIQPVEPVAEPAPQMLASATPDTVEAAMAADSTDVETMAEPAVGPLAATEAVAQPEPMAPEVADAAPTVPAAQTAFAAEQPMLGAAGEQKLAAINPAPTPATAGPASLREAADAGDPRALFEIGSRYAEGRNGEADMTEAARWYQRAADAGFAPAQYRIGSFYEKGLGVERDVAKARALYEASATQGNASAMHNLAVLYAMGADGAPDNENAVKWFTAAADHGIKDSQFNLGILAAKGVGMPQDLEASYKWFALVAKGGDSDAAAKRDEIAKTLKPAELEKAKASADQWKAKETDAAANDVSVPADWRESQDTTASVDLKQAVRNIQRILNKNGYDAGEPDGVMGGKTKSAVIAFQAANDLTPDGEINEPLVRALLAKK